MGTKKVGVGGAGTVEEARPCERLKGTVDITSSRWSVTCVSILQKTEVKRRLLGTDQQIAAPPPFYNCQFTSTHGFRWYTMNGASSLKLASLGQSFPSKMLSKFSNVDLRPYTALLPGRLAQPSTRPRM